MRPARRVLPVIVLCLAACGGGDAPGDSDFANPEPGKMHLRHLKHRDEMPPARDRELLETTFFPEKEGWRCHGHEIVTPAAARVRIDVGDRVDMRDADDWPLASGDDDAPGPAWLLHVDVRSLPDAPFVVLTGSSAGSPPRLRVVVVGDVDGVTAEGGALTPRTDDPELPQAFVIDRDVPAARGGHLHPFSTGRFGSNGVFLVAPFPMDGPTLLTAWAQIPITGGSSSGMSNDLHYMESGDVRVASDGFGVSVRVAGAEVEWTEHPHVLWAVRMSAEPR